MVYSSIPVYVDPPNWQQQANLHQANGSDNSTQLLPPLPPQAGQPPMGGAGMGSIRPGSMADRARLAKIPPPEAALKCPRCESTNTKFCYFNNYSLSQPRHFCKTCRRYWTRGGALRNVPVGGGCRRNKKNKRSRSKSPASNTTEKQQPLTNSLSSSSPGAIIPNNHPSGGNTHELIGLPHQPPNLPFMASLHQNLNNRYGVVGNIGLSLREIQGQTAQQHHMGFQIGLANNSDPAHHHQWRLQQFPFLNGFESSSNSTAAASSYPFQNEGINNNNNNNNNNNDVNEAPSGLVGDIAVLGSRVTANTQQMQPLSPVKMEENGAINNLSRSHLNNNNNNVSENNQYYSWTDMSGLASSSTTHLL